MKFISYEILSVLRLLWALIANYLKFLDEILTR